MSKTSQWKMVKPNESSASVDVTTRIQFIGQVSADLEGGIPEPTASIPSQGSTAAVFDTVLPGVTSG